jgi:hypothetical protein
VVRRSGRKGVVSSSNEILGELSSSRGRAASHAAEIPLSTAESCGSSSELPRPQGLVITPQATRSPAFPAGSVFMSSALA